MKKIIYFMAVIISGCLFLGCAFDTPDEKTSSETQDIGTEIIEDAQSQKVQTIYKLSEKFDLSVEIQDTELEENPWGYDLTLIIPSVISEMEAVDEAEQITNAEFDTKGNFNVTTTTTQDHIIYTNSEGQEELKNTCLNNFERFIAEFNRNGLGLYISYNDDFSEFEITGSQDAISDLPDLYINTLMKLGAFYQAIQGKSADEIEVTVTAYYYS